MEILTVLTMLALLQYIVFSFLVGGARGRYGVEAPSTTGNHMFERYYRVQMNTLEQLVIFIPGLWAFGYYVSAYWALLPGIAYLAGRTWFAYAYINNPPSRGPGVILTIVSGWGLVVGGLIGALVAYF